MELTGAVRDGAVRQVRETVVAAITELRAVVVALHPVTRVHGSLAEAIQAVANLYGRRAGFDVNVAVEPGVSDVRDQLIVSLAREMLRNVAQHSEASHVTIGVRRVRDEAVFEVADDGRGMDADRPRAALDGGHIGLASIAMRVEACGGRFRLDSSPGEGTRVRVTLPTGAPTGPLQSPHCS